MLDGHKVEKHVVPEEKACGARRRPRCERGAEQPGAGAGKTGKVTHTIHPL